MAERIAAAARTHAWLVYEIDGRVVGYAYGGPMKARAAYRWSCEVSVYLEPGLRRTGAGRALYEALFARLAERGYRTAVAGMTLPNPASEGLHRALGFEPVGTFRQVGWKHGAWHDVAWVQRLARRRRRTADRTALTRRRRADHPTPIASRARWSTLPDTAIAFCAPRSR